MNDAYLGLGSNLGDRVATLRAAVAALDGLPNTRVTALSRVYETEPWGPADQPRYANAVARIQTTLEADRLLESINEIEEALGRVREERYGARTVDIDILLFGDEEWESARLTIPHPRMLEREFVVVPLLEIAPGLRLPDGTPVTRDAAVHGRITGELGAIIEAESLADRDMPEPPPSMDAVVDSPDMLEAAEQAVFAMAEQPLRPVPPGDEWVEMLSGMQGMLMTQQGSFDLQLKAGALEAAGIPVVIDPPPILTSPGLPYYGVIEQVRLYVPASYEREACEILGLPPVGRSDSAQTHVPRPAQPTRDYSASYPRVWKAYAWLVVIYVAAVALIALYNTLAELFG